MNEPGKKYRLAVIGSRGYTNKEHIFKILDANKHQIKLIVSGGCKNSADEVAHDYCKENAIPILIFYPQWYHPETGIFQKGAGFSRNYDIIRQADKILAFSLNNSKGTAHSIQIAKDLGKPVKIIDVSKEMDKEPAANMGKMEHDDKGDN